MMSCQIRLSSWLHGALSFYLLYMKVIGILHALKYGCFTRQFTARADLFLN